MYHEIDFTNKENVFSKFEIDFTQEEIVFHDKWQWALLIGSHCAKGDL
jgi:hypothetical protein